MHSSVMRWARRQLSQYADEIRGHHVIELGSQNVNGSLRPWITVRCKPKSYLGVDAQVGPGVDLVADVTRPFAPPRAAYRLLICTEMLEHVKDWRGAVRVLKSLISPNGLLLLTTRSLGFPYHGYPEDFWRFSLEDIRRIFTDMTIITLDADEPTTPGVMLFARAGVVRDYDLDEIEVVPMTPP